MFCDVCSTQDTSEDPHMEVLLVNDVDVYSIGHAVGGVMNHLSMGGNCKCI